MFAGLPGTGLGGVFYLLLTLWMPINELYRLARGRSSLERWRFIAGRWAIFGVVLAAMWGQAALIRAFMGDEAADMLGAAAMSGLSGESQASGDGLLATAAMGAVASLGVIVLLVHIVRIGVAISRPAPARA